MARVVGTWFDVLSNVYQLKGYVLMRERSIARPSFLLGRSFDLDRVITVARIGVIVASALLLIKSSVVESFYVPSVSMLPTLQSDDCVIVPKFSYGLRLPFSRHTVFSWGTPTRGEVVVFRRDDDPKTRIDESEKTMVKRVIGVPGDRIRIVGSSVSVNGSVLSESYARWTKGGISSEQLFVVPTGSLFLLGDNRDESYDSRFWQEPFIKTNQVVGPVSAVYWSPRDLERAGTLVY